MSLHDPSSKRPADVCIVGGAGHIGLPLALVLASNGNVVLCLDKNEKALTGISEGRMPFLENGAEPLLREVLAAGNLRLSSEPEQISGVRTVILTIGTPVDDFLNPSWKAVKQCIDGIAPHLGESELIIFRSTLYPGTTERMAAYLKEDLGIEIMVANCPERVVQGQAIEEMRMLPQIVSGVTPEAEEAAVEFFEAFAPTTVRLSPTESEFAKLLANVWRYIEFAIANQFFTITTAAGVDFFKVFEGMKDRYPRLASMPSPGFTAGPCLFKDTMQLMSFFDNQFSLGNAAMLVNEGLPLFIAEQLSKKHDLRSVTIGLLGMSFKADIDDSRSSLSYKLKKVLAFKSSRILTTDPFVQDDPELSPLENVIEKSDILVLCTPHTCYKDLDLEHKIVIDVWNLFGRGSGL